MCPRVTVMRGHANCQRLWKSLWKLKLSVLAGLSKNHPVGDDRALRPT